MSFCHPPLFSRRSESVRVFTAAPEIEHVAVPLLRIVLASLAFLVSLGPHIRTGLSVHSLLEHAGAPLLQALGSSLPPSAPCHNVQLGNKSYVQSSVIGIRLTLSFCYLGPHGPCQVLRALLLSRSSRSLSSPSRPRPLCQQCKHSLESVITSRLWKAVLHCLF